VGHPRPAQPPGALGDRPRVVRNQQTTGHVSGVVARYRSWRASRSLAGVLCGPCSCVGFGIRRKMEAIGTWQRISVGKRVSKRRDWLFEQVKDRLVSGVPERLRQSFELVPGPVREPEDPVTH